MMLEFRMVCRDIPIIVDTDYQRIPFVVLYRIIAVLSIKISE